MLVKHYTINEKIIHQLKVCYFKNNKLFVCEDSVSPKTYLVIPPEVCVKILPLSVSFIFTEQNKKTASNFLFLFEKFLFRTKKNFVRKIFFKGLGFKSSLLNAGEVLRLKVGFSHFVDIKVPTTKLKLFLRKNVIHATSFNPIVLGSFFQKIKSVRYPNSYTGKGFWYKNEIQQLKSFKKK